MKSLIGFAVIAAIVYLVLKGRNKNTSGNGSVDVDLKTNTNGNSAGGSPDLTTIINKVGRTFMSGKYDDGLQLINDNIDKYEGEDKAQLLNQRGGLYTIKGDHQSALADYKLAYEIDDNITNLTNYAECLLKLNMIAEAKPIAEAGLKNPNLDKSGRKMLEQIMNS